MHACNTNRFVLLPTSISSADVENFLQVLSWGVAGTISEREFAELYAVWQSRGRAPSPPRANFGEREMRSLLRGRVESDLDLMLGLLINENNKQLVASGRVSARWVSLAEQLFFKLDQVTLDRDFASLFIFASFFSNFFMQGGRGYVTVDDLLFFMLALIGTDAVSLTVEGLLKHTHQFMRDVGTICGAVPLSQFKVFFVRNMFDEFTLEMSLRRLSAEMNRWKPLRFAGLRSAVDHISRCRVCRYSYLNACIYTMQAQTVVLLFCGNKR